jgi:hypothetical protein
MNATQYSAKFNLAKDDTIVSFKERITNFLEAYPTVEARCLAYGEEWRGRYPEITKFEDLYAFMPGMGSNLKHIWEAYIDASMQRDIKFIWVTEGITANFDQSLVNPVLFTNYENKDCIWDGQQTTTSLVLVAMFFFGMSLDEAINRVKVPCVMYPSDVPGKLRDRFIKNNDGSIKEPLTRCDLVEQMIYAVRVDNSKEQMHLHVNKIFSAMEEYGLFFSDETRTCVNRPGALSRYTEIYNTKKFDTDDIINVIKYHGIAKKGSPVEPLEIDNLSQIFMLAREQGIVVDDDYVQAFANALHRITENTWSTKDTKAISKHKSVLRSYSQWRDRMVADNPENEYIIPKRCNQTLVAPAWICQALKAKNFKYSLPKMTGKYRYNFTKQELGV